MKLPSPGFLLNAFLQVCRRFPGTMLVTFTGVVTLLILIESGNSSNEELLTRMWMVAQLGLPLLTGVVVFGESANWTQERKWLAQGIGILVLAAYCWYLFLQPNRNFEYLHLGRYLIFLLVAHLLVSVAPYLNQRSVADFWEYNRRLFANFVVGATFTMILYSGLSLAVLAVDQLFNLRIDFKIYARLFVLLAGIFNTSYFLFHFPEKYEFESEDASYNAVFRNLCKYILIPIVGLYFLILYAYGAKILATWALPRGFVSSLVIGFSVAGIFTYLLNFYLPQFDSSKMVGWYRKWFWWILLPLTLLLFVAVGKRIADYGVTEARFIIVQTGTWLAITCLYFLFSKSDNLKFIPISLGIIALTLAIGPLSAFSVAQRSQTSLLKDILERNGRWENGHIKPAKQPMLGAEIDQVESILYFLDRRGELETADWLPMPIDSFESDEMSYTNSGRIVSWLGMKPSNTPESTTLTLSGQGSAKTDIRGFTQYYPISLQNYRAAQPDKGYFFELSKDGKKLFWQSVKDKKVNLVESFDLQKLMQNWRSSTKEDYVNLSDEATHFDLTGAKGTLRIRINDAQVTSDETGLHVSYLNGQLFLKEK